MNPHSEQLKRHANETRALPGRDPGLGEMVRVRTRRWLVEEVTPGGRPGESARVRLACADDDAQGQELEVFWKYELDRAILDDEPWDDLADRGFDAPEYFAAFLNTLRWNCTTATDPSLFQAPFRAGITLDAYQMEPLRKALRLPRVNLFIADDTGLGKTIEAGLIARELLLRRKAKTIVVAAPPSVLEQWKAEMEERFGLVFQILDRHYVATMRRERGFGVNPWRTHSRFLVSHRLLADPAYADPMREWLGTMSPGSLLILDEAHHAAPSRGGRYGIESKFTARDPGSLLPLRAPPLPVRHAAQRALEQLLHVVGTARPAPLHARRQGAREEGSRRRDDPSPQGGHPRDSGWLPQAGRETGRHRQPAGGRAGNRALKAAGRIPNRAGPALRYGNGPGAGGGRAARRRSSTAPPVVHRGVRHQSRAAPEDGGEAMGGRDRPQGGKRRAATLAAERRAGLLAEGFPDDTGGGRRGPRRRRGSCGGGAARGRQPGGRVGVEARCPDRGLVAEGAAPARPHAGGRGIRAHAPRREDARAPRLDPGEPVSRTSALRNACSGDAPLERAPGADLHRTCGGHQAVPQGRPVARHRGDGQGGGAHRGDRGGHERRAAQGNPAPLQHASVAGSAAHPAGDGRGARGAELPGALHRPVSLRSALESRPDRAAQRAHRPQAPTGG